VTHRTRLSQGQTSRFWATFTARNKGLEVRNLHYRARSSLDIETSESDSVGNDSGGPRAHHELELQTETVQSFTATTSNYEGEGGVRDGQSKVDHDSE
jgi:hypothetical protein